MTTTKKKARRTKPTILRESYAHAKQAEALISDPNLRGAVRAQLEQAMIEAAEEMGINIFHPALIRQAFIEIMRQSGENFRLGVRRSIHHFEKPVIRLLSIVDYAAEGRTLDEEELARMDLETGAESERYGYPNTGMERHSYVALQRFIKAAELREVSRAIDASENDAGWQVSDNIGQPKHKPKSTPRR